eukprot:1836913-Pyramimonas_sp.AAC.1
MLGPWRSGPLPLDRFFVQSCFWTLPRPGEGPRRLKTAKIPPLQFFGASDLEGVWWTRMSAVLLN